MKTYVIKACNLNLDLKKNFLSLFVMASKKSKTLSQGACLHKADIIPCPVCWRFVSIVMLRVKTDCLMLSKERGGLVII